GIVFLLCVEFLYESIGKLHSICFAGHGAFPCQEQWDEPGTNVCENHSNLMKLYATEYKGKSRT
ncbi:MAG: hypothetical protein QF787_17595, partial [Nitrospinota bacterium]|nr:hypothetical protein [Nitrospinota bacterium]